LRKKEQLADGLHLIDFEQLKIENQTLNEKIEERNDELAKLRSKIVANVIILSHTREKYQFIIKANQKQRESLA
jgi:histone deacetylase 6